MLGSKVWIESNNYITMDISYNNQTSILRSIRKKKWVQNFKKTQKLFNWCCYQTIFSEKAKQHKETI